MNFGVEELMLAQFVMAMLFKGQVLAVIGGRDTATEEALYLTKYGRHVHLLVRKDQLRASKAMQDRVYNNPNITVHFNTEGQMTGMLVRKVDTGEEYVLEAKGLFYGIGHSPNVQFLEGQIELDSSGYVLEKEGTANTSVEGVFAAGDVQDHEWRQAISAAGSGCIAALSVERYLSSNNLRVEFHQTNTEEVKKELTGRDVQEGFDITLTKHKGQYALRKLYHESPRLICALYTAPSCGPCRTLKPILSKVIDELIRMFITLKSILWKILRLQRRLELWAHHVRNSLRIRKCSGLCLESK